MPMGDCPDLMSLFCSAPIRSIFETSRLSQLVSRQNQGMDGPGVGQAPEDSGEQGKWRKLVAKSSVVPQHNG